MKFRNHWLIFCSFPLLGLVGFISCSKEPIPKPYGQIRLEYPVAKYQWYKSDCPFEFQYSDYATITPRKEYCWLNIEYPFMKSRIYITYNALNNDLLQRTKEAEKMVYEHTIRASSIKGQAFEFPDKKVYGSMFKLGGESATNISFYATDSLKHFISGNLYFRSSPQPDSLKPAVEYMEKDIRHLIETLNWK